MNIWIVGIGLKKKYFLLRDPFIASSTCLELVIKIINMPAKFGEILRLRIWESITIYIYELALYSWQMYSKLLGRFA